MKQSKNPFNPLLVIQNTHAVACGEPPHLTNADQFHYLGYFAGEHGDQWVFVFDRATKDATIRGGDLGWEKEITVSSPTELPYHFTKAERRWAEACWQAATALQPSVN